MVACLSVSLLFSPFVQLASMDFRDLLTFLLRRARSDAVIDPTCELDTKPSLPPASLSLQPLPPFPSSSQLLPKRIPDVLTPLSASPPPPLSLFLDLVSLSSPPSNDGRLSFLPSRHRFPSILYQFLLLSHFSLGEYVRILRKMQMYLVGVMALGESDERQSSTDLPFLFLHLFPLSSPVPFHVVSSLSGSGAKG